MSNSWPRAFARLRSSPYSRADHRQVLEAGQIFVDRCVLSGEADPLAQLRGILDDVEPVYLRRPSVPLQQRGEHVHERRLAGPVRTQQAQDRPAGHIEVHAGERMHPPKRLGDAPYRDRAVRVERVGPSALVSCE